MRFTLLTLLALLVACICALSVDSASKEKRCTEKRALDHSAQEAIQCSAHKKQPKNGILDGQAFGNWVYENTVTPHYKNLRYVKIAPGDYTMVNGGVYFALSSDVVLDFGVTITMQDHQAEWFWCNTNIRTLQ
ncbi:hypothetical protein BZG36_00362 [Bifiguratus adelaidae]|uniref:Uncharacterized protein n=1 Tax=Bifiguratus adelaidae TaxID=1938954 RepID=A0A261Y809_9FUNG|nr:hypothetical protein BZG36_00362 [Bifiguratus adelaidae]